MLNSFTSSHPLDVSKAETTCSTQRIGMIDKSFGNNGHRFEAAMRMGGKPRNALPVIHTPALLIYSKIIPDVPAGK